MHNIIKSQKQKIIMAMFIIVMAIVNIPLFTRATSVVDTTEPTINDSNVKSGRYEKSGSEWSFTITDGMSGVADIIYQWDRHFNKGTKLQEYHLTDQDNKESFDFNVKIDFDSDNLGLHEFSIAARDVAGNVTTWHDYALYVVEDMTRI